MSESQASGSSPDPNQVFFDTVGGFRKGEVYGLGKFGSSLYYEKPSRGHAASANSPLLSAQLADMSERLEESEQLLMEERRARREMEEKQKQQEEYLQQMKAQMDAIMRRFGGPSSFPGGPEDGTDGSGASGAFVAS